MNAVELGPNADAPENIDPDEQVWQGISSFLDEYLHLSAEDHAILLYARNAREPSAWVAAEIEFRGIPVSLLDLDSLSPATIESFSEKLLKASSGLGSGASRLIVLCLEYEIVMPSAWIRKVLDPFAGRKVEIFRTVMTSAEFFQQGVTVSPAKLSEINGGLLRSLRPAEKFKVTSTSGSELDITLDPGRYQWISSRGIAREGAFVMLPAGEVATYPAQISGTLVADGAFNSTAFTKLDARLEKHPVTFQIDNGVMVDYHCDNATIEKFIDRFLHVPNACRVGELGFGTNFGIEHFIPLNSHLNERHPGLHIGFGQSNQKSGTVHSCDVHVDFIASDCVINIPGENPLASSDFKTLAGDHPAIEPGVRDEDLDGDCCGLFSMHSPAQCRY